MKVPDIFACFQIFLRTKTFFSRKMPDILCPTAISTSDNNAISQANLLNHFREKKQVIVTFWISNN